MGEWPLVRLWSSRFNRDTLGIPLNPGGLVGRRGIKEFRADEALQLILADRDHEELACPSCGSGDIQRTPKRRISSARWDRHRQVTLQCNSCGRRAVYVPRNVTQPSHPELTV